MARASIKRRRWPSTGQVGWRSHSDSVAAERHRPGRSGRWMVIVMTEAHGSEQSAKPLCAVIRPGKALKICCHESDPTAQVLNVDPVGPKQLQMALRFHDWMQAAVDQFEQRAFPRPIGTETVDSRDGVASRGWRLGVHSARLQPRGHQTRLQPSDSPRVDRPRSAHPGNRSGGLTMLTPELPRSELFKAGESEVLTFKQHKLRQGHRGCLETHGQCGCIVAEPERWCCLRAN